MEKYSKYGIHPSIPALSYAGLQGFSGTYFSLFRGKAYQVSNKPTETLNSLFFSYLDQTQLAPLHPS